MDTSASASCVGMAAMEGYPTRGPMTVDRETTAGALATDTPEVVAVYKVVDCSGALDMALTSTHAPTVATATSAKLM